MSVGASPTRAADYIYACVAQLVEREFCKLKVFAGPSPVMGLFKHRYDKLNISNYIYTILRLIRHATPLWPTNGVKMMMDRT